MFHVGMHSYSKLPVEQAIMGLLSTFTANLSLMAIGLLQAPSTILLDYVPAVYLEYDTARACVCHFMQSRRFNLIIARPRIDGFLESGLLVNTFIGATIADFEWKFQ